MNTDTSKRTDKPHILVVDDDTRIRTLVSRFLHEHGFIVLTADCARDARDMLARFSFDALVVDVMMPGQTGVEFTRDLRIQGIDTPILLLTALAEADDRIAGFEGGADDYLPKPFEPKELVLRLRSILRRTQRVEPKKTLFQIGAWLFNPDHDSLENNDGYLPLTTVEANLLRALSESIGDVVTRQDLAARCGLDAGERTIDVQVTRLRRKIEENTKAPRYLQTVRGKGYILRAVRV